jgi:DNA modification methylase
MSERVKLYLGDCREVMAGLEPEMVDAIVSDPPYGYIFMGKGWDRGVPGGEFWTEALRVAKPGAHLLAFGGTRTFHRLACAIEDAGWEIRDCVMWVYGSGFPKSHNIGKAIDKMAGAAREVVGEYAHPDGRPRQWSDHAGERNVTGKRGPDRIETAPATEAARRWEGWGTALKPAWEPIIVARKPFGGTVAANVLARGTGAINVEGCRVGADGGCKTDTPYLGGPASNALGRGLNDQRSPAVDGLGRWPANLIHDGSAEVLAGFPVTTSGKMQPTHTTAGAAGRNAYGADKAGGYTTMETYGDTGSAARFFYCAKASKADRDAGLGDLPEATPGQRSGRVEGSAGTNPYAGTRGPARNIHPTVKPTDLMRYLCRLVTPPGGVVLDPFMGSGSTGRGAVLEGFRFVGIDLTPEYVEIARRRIADAERERDAAEPVQPGLFGGTDGA